MRNYSTFPYMRSNGTHLAELGDMGNSIVGYIVKVYDPLGTVPAFYRSVRNTWVHSRATEALRVFTSERSARAFIAIQGPFTGLEMCVETV